LEKPYFHQDYSQLPAADAVVMLGGTLNPSRGDPFAFDFSAAADRAIAATEIIRRGKAKILVVGGSGEPGGKSQEGELLPSWLEAWKVQPAELVPLRASGDTHDEARQVEVLARERGWQRILLVTSASHMRRASATFLTLGVPVVPVACDFSGMSDLEGRHRLNLVPRGEGFRRIELYLHEVIGWYVYKWRGWIR
jgi:uncharacterized SAM-binding protein YcdF (DUF218 family)